MAIEILSRGRGGTRNVNKRILAINTELAAKQPRVIPTYTVATVPAAATNAGVLIRVSDGDAGQPCLAVSDGADWLRIAYGAAIAAA